MRHKRIALILVLAGGLLLTTSVLAMSSTNYAVDWMVPLSGGGGGYASSASYVVHLTIGQTATGRASNDSFQAGLGFWYGMRDYIMEVMLPLLQK